MVVSHFEVGPGAGLDIDLEVSAAYEDMSPSEDGKGISERDGDDVGAEGDIVPAIDGRVEGFSWIADEGEEENGRLGKPDPFDLVADFFLFFGGLGLIGFTFGSDHIFHLGEVFDEDHDALAEQGILWEVVEEDCPFFDDDDDIQFVVVYVDEGLNIPFQV